jgi:hypothetical protein
MAPEQKDPAAGTKQPYAPPKLVVHGDLKTLAKATMKGGTRQDGGKPRSRMGGPQG